MLPRGRGRAGSGACVEGAAIGLVGAGAAVGRTASGAGRGRTPSVVPMLDNADNRDCVGVIAMGGSS